jgi:hypothetical protein
MQKKMPKRKREVQKEELPKANSNAMDIDSDNKDQEDNGPVLRSKRPSRRQDLFLTAGNVLETLNKVVNKTRLLRDINQIISVYAESDCTVSLLVTISPAGSKEGMCLANGRLYIATSFSLYEYDLVTGNIVAKRMAYMGNWFTGSLNLLPSVSSESMSQNVRLGGYGRLQERQSDITMIDSAYPSDIHDPTHFNLTTLRHSDQDFPYNRRFLCVDFTTGHIYTSDQDAGHILKSEDETKTFQLFAGDGSGRSIDSLDCKTASFDDPYAMVVCSASRQLFIFEAETLRCIDLTSLATRTICRSSYMRQVLHVAVLSKFELIACTATNQVIAINIFSYPFAYPIRIVAGSKLVGSTNGHGPLARFDSPKAICIAPDGNTAYVLQNSSVRMLSGLF